MSEEADKEISQDLEKLRSIGAQKIHQRTHIALKNVQAILHLSFEDIQKVQLMGFVSILEREYGVNLDEVRQSALAYYKEQEEKASSQEEPEYKKELLTSGTKGKKPLLALAAVLVLLVLAFALFFFLKDSSSGDANAQKAQISTQSTVEQNLKPDEESSENSEAIQEGSVAQEENATLKGADDENLSKNDENLSANLDETVVTPTLRIIPKTKVWVGYIDLANGKKKQTVTKNELDLNGSKDYLLTFGHGFIDIDTSGKLHSFEKSKGLKFLYKDGNLEEIDAQEFKRYNKGKLW